MSPKVDSVLNAFSHSEKANNSEGAQWHSEGAQPPLAPPWRRHYSISILSKRADDMNGDPEKTNFVFQSVSVSQKGQCTGSIDGDVSNEYAVL